MHSLAPLAYIRSHMPDGLMFLFCMGGEAGKVPKKGNRKIKDKQCEFILAFDINKPTNTAQPAILTNRDKARNDREKEKRLSYHPLTVAPGGVQLLST